MKKKPGTGSKWGKEHQQGAGRATAGAGRDAGKAGAGMARAGAAGERNPAGGARRQGARPAPKRVDAPVSVGQLVEADMIGIGHDGEGVGRTRDGYTLFIHGALPGEKVTARVEHTKKQFGYARLAEVLKQSGDRVAAPCPIYAECGGCQLQHLSYEGQLRWKRQHVVDALERIGKLQVQGSGSAGIEADEADGVAKSIGRGAGIVVHPTLGMDEPWRYRNKAQVPIGQEEGGLVGGFYAQGSHRIIDMEACLIQHEKNDDVVRRVKRIAGELGIRAYDEASGRGLLRHVVVKVGFRTGDVMVVLVTNGEKVQRVDELVGLIREEVPGVKSIVQNVNMGRTNVIFGDRTVVLWGEEYIRDWIGDIQFAISARSFYQVNPVQTEVLYGKALEYAGLSGGETVIDAYCGIGTISLFLAQRAGHVYGVEIVEDAIADARRNAELNGMTSKVTFEAGPAEVVIPAWKRDGVAADVIVVDPPRKGCDAALLQTIGEMQPERVVYVSCNPATLARDLRMLEDAGYRTVEVQPVDMFPHTVHVESVALLVRDETGIRKV
jgi:23S rRNA (uracil1939-C5)-methyltransferase